MRKAIVLEAGFSRYPHGRGLKPGKNRKLGGSEGDEHKEPAQEAREISYLYSRGLGSCAHFLILPTFLNSIEGMWSISDAPATTPLPNIRLVNNMCLHLRPCATSSSSPAVLFAVLTALLLAARPRVGKSVLRIHCQAI